MYSDDLFASNQQPRIVARLVGDFPFDDFTNCRILRPMFRRKPNLRRSKNSELGHAQIIALLLRCSGRTKDPLWETREASAYRVSRLAETRSLIARTSVCGLATSESSSR